MSEDEVKDLIGEFVVDGYRFKVVTTHVPTKNPDAVEIIRAGGIFHTDFYLTVSYQTYQTLVEKDFMDIFFDMLKAEVPRLIARLES